MNVWAMKAKWIKTCFVSNKRYGITITKLSVLFHVSIDNIIYDVTYKVVVVTEQLHNIADNIKETRKKNR